MLEQLDFLIRSLPHLLIGFPGSRPGGLLLSFFLAVAGIGLGFVIALFIGTGSYAAKRPIRWICQLYVAIFRGLPLILLLVLIHQVIGGQRFGLNFSPRTSAVTALALYSGAYQAEIVKAGLRTVPVQLIESARLIGSTPWQVYRWIQLRYALRVMLPAFTGEAISLFKDTSVVIIIGVAELMTVARVTLGSTVTNAPYWVSIYLLVGFLYFCVAFGLSQWTQHWERQRQTKTLVHSLDY